MESIKIKGYHLLIQIQSFGLELIKGKSLATKLVVT